MVPGDPGFWRLHTGEPSLGILEGGLIAFAPLAAPFPQPHPQPLSLVSHLALRLTDAGSTPAYPVFH